MNSKNQQLKQIIEGLVAKEVKRQVSQLVPLLVKEAMSQVMSNLISESVDDVFPSVQGNTNKRRALTETVSMTPMPVQPKMSRAEMAARMGYGDMSDVMPSSEYMAGWNNGNGNGHGLITVDSAMPADPESSYNPIPINSAAIPEHLLRAFNRNYRPVLDAFNK